MKKLLSLIALVVVLVGSSFAQSADRVVVVPLGRTVNINAPIAWQGQWQEGAEYSIGDGLQYTGSSYICTESHTSSIANSPPNSSFWSLMAAQGNKGDIGATGVIGATGPQGIQGALGVQGLQGEVGPEGPQGGVGSVGPEGPQGIQGVAGPQGPTGAGAIQIYDANDQYIGIFLGHAGTNLEIFIPIMKIILLLSAQNGLPADSVTFLWYPTPDCSGNTYYIKAESHPGRLLRNRYNATYAYVTSSFTSAGMDLDWQSYEDQDGVCTSQNVTMNNMYRAQLVTAAEVPFTIPVTFPLRFEISQ